MIGRLDVCRISLQTSYPSMPGSIRSKSRRSGWKDSIANRADSPSFSIRHSKHSLVRYKEMSSAILLSSSTISIFCFDAITASLDRNHLNLTIVTPASPSPYSARWNSAIWRCLRRYWWIPFLKAPVPFPCTMRTLPRCAR